MTGGVVRRDGLREAAELAREILSHFDHRGHPGRDCRRTGWVAVEMVEAWSERLRVLDAVPDVPPTEALVIHIEADALDGGFVSSVDGIPGCISQGQTSREAVESVLDLLDQLRDAAPGECVCDPSGPCLGVPAAVADDGVGRTACEACLALDPDRNCLAFDGLAHGRSRPPADTDTWSGQ